MDKPIPMTLVKKLVNASIKAMKDKRINRERIS